MKKYITVIGGEKDASAEDLKLAEEVGKLIAKAGAILVCGGRQGVMEAAAKGAKASGGLTIGILPSNDKQEANAYIDVPIVTGLGFARNKMVVANGDAVIAIGGRYGTLSEIAFALVAGKPVIGLGTWRLQKANGELDKSIVYANSPQEAVETALKLITA